MSPRWLGAYQSPEQAEKLLKFLISEEHALIMIATDEGRDVNEACAMVVNLLIERAKKKRYLPESEL